MSKDSHIKFANAKQPELFNLSTKLLEKCSEEKLSIAKISQIMDLGEMTIRRIMYQPEAYSPNIKILYPIADYFGCSITDLLSANYLLQVPCFLSLDDFHNQLNVAQRKYPVSREIYMKAKYNKFVYIHYFNDLGELFTKTDELPSMHSDIPLGCILSLKDQACFGYLEIGKVTHKFNDLTNMQRLELTTAEIQLLAIKEKSLEASATTGKYLD
jgi:transcriptional regulator with XRE-family HTH domain